MKAREITLTPGEVGRVKHLIGEMYKTHADEGTLIYQDCRITWDDEKIVFRFLDGAQFKKDYPLPTKGDCPGP